MFSCTDLVEFTDEEGYGRYLDLHDCYLKYINLKGAEVRSSLLFLMDPIPVCEIIYIFFFPCSDVLFYSCRNWNTSPICRRLISSSISPKIERTLSTKGNVHVNKSGCGGMLFIHLLIVFITLT